MFSLFIDINHKKMLEKTESLDVEDLVKSLKELLQERGGVLSEFSELLSHFPSKYEYSRRQFLSTVKDIYILLTKNSDLVGFSLIVDISRVQNDFDYTELRNRLVLSTTEVDGLWFTKDAYTLVSNWIYGDKGGKLVHIFNGFIKMDFTMDHIFDNLINSQLQSLFLRFKPGINYLSGKMSDALEKNLKYNRDVLMFNPGISCEPRLTLIDFIMTQRSKFDPERDLNDEEKLEWGRYLDLYSKFSERSYDCFILDDAIIHFNKLIILWFASYTKRYSTILVIWGADGMDRSLWNILALTDNLKIVFLSESLNADFHLPPLKSAEDRIDTPLKEYILSQSYDAVMVLYLILLTKGAILISDILKVVGRYNSNTLRLKEEVEHFKRMGLLIGEQFLFPGVDNLEEMIAELYREQCNRWKGDFLQSFEDLKFQRVFSYSYIYALMGLSKSSSGPALKVLYNYIRKILDLGLTVELKSDFLQYSYRSDTMGNILEYKRVRESRLEHNITTVGAVKDGSGFKTPLEFLSLLNIWSEHRDDNLMERSKKLYFHYQNNGDSYNESRVKTLFALGILSEGNVSECVDYFELNCSYSKMISDTYSYIRNGSFLAMSLFVKGDFSGVLRVSSIFLKHNWIFFKTRWHLYLLFIRARALMELNRFDDAITLIDDGIVIIKNCNYSDMLETFRNWKGRILYYMGKEGAARETLLSGKVNREANFFLAEIEFFSGHNTRAKRYIDRALDGREDQILFDEKLKWSSGYYVIEEFFNRSRSKSILDEEISNFSYLIDISLGDSDRLDEYIDVINLIPNSSRALYNYKYIYFLYMATEGMDVDSRLNRDNIINKAVRLVQQRASNMSEHNHKHLYLENFYNRKVMEELKSKKVY